MMDNAWLREATTILASSSSAVLRDRLRPRSGIQSLPPAMQRGPPAPSCAGPADLSVIRMTWTCRLTQRRVT